MKKFLALMLAALMVVGCFTACANQNAPADTTAAGPTEPAEEAKELKVLTLGHSLAVDAGHMLALIAAAEGYESMTVATLYYSGCPLYKHVEYLQTNAREYDLYVSSTKTADQPPKIMEDVTMGEALKHDYWDIIIMQGGVFEIADGATFTNGNIQTIQKYVNDNKLNPNAVFGWNMAWASPINEQLRSTYPGEGKNPYIENYTKFNNDRTTFYNMITRCVNDHIVPNETFQYLIPSGTAIENALSSYLEETDLHRDYVHATDLGRVIVSYTWFCVLTGAEKLEEVKLDAIPKAFFKSTQGTEDRVLTQAEKDLIIESVNNALANPLKMTKSQYTQAPA